MRSIAEAVIAATFAAFLSALKASILAFISVSRENVYMSVSSTKKCKKERSVGQGLAIVNTHQE